MPDRIRVDIDIINMQLEYSDMDMVSDVEYPDLDTDEFKSLQINTVSNTVEKYQYHFQPYQAGSCTPCRGLLNSEQGASYDACTGGDSAP
jgi:hypothetical protein